MHSLTSHRGSQTRIIRELTLAFSNATTIECSHVGDVAVIKMELVTDNCKARKVNVFRVGPKGGLRVIKQEFNGND